MNRSPRLNLLGALTKLTVLAVIGGIGAESLAAQTVIPVRDGSLANSDPYLYAAEDFGIDPTQVTYHKDIAPILQTNCAMCHGEEGHGDGPSAAARCRRSSSNATSASSTSATHST